MINEKLIDMLHATYPKQTYDSNLIKGYTESELSQMERLYDIEITGELRTFLSCMGRCSGGLLDEPLVFYDRNKVRSHFLLQERLRDELSPLEPINCYKEKSFLISVESETQYYFLLTASEEPNRVYHFNENYGTVDVTNWTFNEYLVHIMKDEVPMYAVKDLVLTGEMIVI